MGARQLLAAGIIGAFIAPVQAADLGGDCCNDLEERVAELEATTVRKGNTKMSLTLRGQVNKAIMYWDSNAIDFDLDDGVNRSDTDVYVGDNENSGTRFMLHGNAQVNRGLEIGFYVEYDIQTNSFEGLDQLNANNESTDIIDASDAYLYFKGTLGRLSIGRNDDANQGIAEIDLSGTTVIADASPDDNFGNFFVVFPVGAFEGIRWNDVINFAPGDGGEAEIVKYDTPTFAGFTLSASWQAGADAAGENEGWDVALRFAQEFGGSIRVAAGVGYGENVNETSVIEFLGIAIPPGDLAESKVNHWATSGSILHVPTGINVSGSYSKRETDFTSIGPSFTVDDDAWYVKAGLLGNWTGMGNTSLYGEYGQYEKSESVLIDAQIEAIYWGAGIVQNIDSAATELYLAYKHVEIDSATAGGGAFNAADFVTLPELDLVMAGARVKF